MDNGTMVEAFKFLNYYQLAKNSLVSKRYWNLIRTHRHKLALLYVDHIYMNSYVANQQPSVIKMFNEVLSTEEYNKWIVRNGYSKQVPFEVRIAEKESTENVRDIYVFRAEVYPDPNNSQAIATSVFNTYVELKDENWPLFQHFIRLITDPAIYIRSLSLYSLKGVFNLLAGAMNPDRDRLQCKRLDIRFNDDTQKFIGWIKDHVRCDEFEIDVDNDSNYDEELLDLFLTGAPCAPSIYVMDYYPSKKFIGLKNRDEYQVVESIRGCIEDRGTAKELKRNFAEFIAEEELDEEGSGSRQVVGFINHNIEKKLTLCASNGAFRFMSFSINITNL
ncbi:hypothetical protein DdX_21136 [Ditylenchus destructor]|uniref:Uncharacterized protein n=1 Tax=Ditylenchus destructor TaxID=166010 RepID=A0AAD4QRI6_9BILA|nr:hypothetical protein DdX_21136 [Ditylenchus destructor]